MQLAPSSLVCPIPDDVPSAVHARFQHSPGSMGRPLGMCIIRQVLVSRANADSRDAVQWKQILPGCVPDLPSFQAGLS